MFKFGTTNVAPITGRQVGQALALAVVYFVAAKLGLQLASVQANATPVWAPTGIALAACLILGYRVWPGILLGAFFANVTTSGTIATSIGLAVGNTLEGVVGAYLVNRFAHGRKAFERAPDIFKFVGLGAVVATAISATFGVTTLSLAGFSSWHSYSVVWGTWWLGDLGGAIIVTPLILVWANQARFKLKLPQVLELIVLLAGLWFMSQMIFGAGGPGAIASYFPLKFLAIPFLIWVAFRFRQREAAIALVLVTTVAIWNTIHGAGTLASATLNQSLVLVQVFMAVMAVMTMSIAAVADEQRVSQRSSEIYTQELAEEQAKDAALLDSIGEGIIATDEQGKIILVNHAFEKLLGLRATEVVGHRTVEVITIEDEHGKPLAEEARALHQAFSKGTPIKLVHYLVRRDGTKFPAAVVATPVVLQGKVVGAIETLDDITQEMEIDRAKSEFVSLASHQLRTPLTAIKWYAGALLGQKKSRLPSKTRHYLETIHGSNQRMINLVSALLNVSRLELGTLRVSPKLVNVTELAQTVITELQAELKAKQLHFTPTFGEVPLLSTDPDLTQVVLQNVLENAIRYTPPGGSIQLEVRRGAGGEVLAGKQLGHDSVVFVVRDSGIGIPQAQQPQVFTKLFRTSSAVRMVPDGTGLGLYIVKSTLGYLGGEVWFESAEKRGSTFYIALPLAGVPPHAGTKQLQ